MDLDYDETIGNPATDACLISIARDEPFWEVTQDALPWTEPADRDASRAVIPIARLESLFRSVTVADPDSLANISVVTRCLHVVWLGDALNALMRGGLEDWEPQLDAPQAMRQADLLTQLQAEADRIIQSNPDLPEFELDPPSFDTYEPLPAGSPFAWLETVDLRALTEKTGDLRAYVDLSNVLGPRALNATRTVGGNQLSAMAGGPSGGQLAALAAAYYSLDPGAGAGALFVAHRLVDFLVDVQWPTPYDVEHTKPVEYAFELAGRAKWASATKGEWPALVRNKLALALRQLPTLGKMFAGSLSNTPLLVREVARLGEVALTGDPAQRLSFWRIEEIEKKVTEQCGGMISEMARGGKDTTEIVTKVIDLLTPSTSANVAGERPPLEEGAEELAAPKRGQIRRAMGEEAYATLETKFLPTLMAPGQPDKDVSSLLSHCFNSKSLLAKAVLLHTPGMRISVYTQASDFLALVADERHHVPHYLGQCVAYDDDLEKVHEDLSTFVLHEQQYELLRTFKWEELDPLNHLVLAIGAEEAGTSMATHDRKKAYHFGDTLNKITRYMGKLFGGLGYPRDVRPEEGVTYESFMKKLGRVVETSMAMTAREADAMLRLVDEYVNEGLKEAAMQAKRTIYCCSPADRHLRAWLGKDSIVLSKIKLTLESLADVRRMRKGLKGVLTNDDPARTLPGFEVHRQGSSQADDDSKRRRPKGQKGKEPAGQSGSGASSSAPRGGGGDNLPMSARAGSMTKEARIKENPKRVFYYDDGKFSMMTRLVDWPKVCEKFGWDQAKLCGPVIMSHARNRDTNCMDAAHR